MKHAPRRRERRGAAAWGRAAICLALGGAPACEPVPDARTPSMADRRAAELPEPSEWAGPWGLFESRRFDARVPLPEATGWRIDDRSSAWLVAVHDGTQSSLLLRTWPELEHVDRRRCEARARSWRDLPGQERDAVGRAATARSFPLIDERAVDVPPGWDTVARTGITRAQQNGPIEAFAVAFGGWAKRCFAFAYTTRAEGPEAERRIGARLVTVLDEVLGRIEFDGAVGDPVSREPLRPSR